jgi:predicted glycosyltransferase
MKKVLVYSHDAYGLGNIRRMLEITAHLVESDPEVHVLLISGSPMLHAFRIPERVDYIKLPCIGRSEKGETVVKSLGISPEETIRMRANIIMMAALDFDPDVVLVDKKPFGLQDELHLALTMLGQRRKRAKTVLLLRDILDAPEVTAAQWEKSGYHEAIRAHYDQVAVVGTEEVFDAVKEYRFPETTADRVRYCGYIKRPAPARSRDQVRAELGFGNEPMVLVTAGGGADGYAMMQTYLQGLAARPPGRPFRTLLISGPEMSPVQRKEIFALAERCRGVTVQEFSSDMIGCMNAADLVISMGGYNTVCELLTLRKKAIIVPRVRPVQEQWIRAERMEAMGLLRALHPDGLSPESLIAAVDEELGRDNVRSAALYNFAMDGLPRIGQLIHELLPQRQPEAPAVAARPQRRQARGSSSGVALRLPVPMAAHV